VISDDRDRQESFGPAVLWALRQGIGKGQSVTVKITDATWLDRPIGSWQITLERVDK
jgi:hypothetical protein